MVGPGHQGRRQIRGRPFNTSTRLGQVMERDGWTVNEVSALSGVNARKMSDYLAGREKMSVDHLFAISDAIGVAPEEIDE